MKKVNEPLRNARLEKGFSQDKVASKAGIRRTRYNQIENGEIPNLRTAYKLAAVVEKPVEDIFLPSNVI